MAGRETSRGVICASPRDGILGAESRVIVSDLFLHLLFEVRERHWLFVETIISKPEIWLSAGDYREIATVRGPINIGKEQKHIPTLRIDYIASSMITEANSQAPSVGWPWLPYLHTRVTWPNKF
jgi:hypothetical protein